MAKLIARASALPGAPPVLPPSPFRHLVRHATERPDGIARMSVTAHGAWESSTWADVRLDVERAAAGLVRRGLRPDQVVVSVVQSERHLAEVELAVRATGAVLVSLAPETRHADLVRLLRDTHVRLVIADTETDLVRLGGARPERAELLLLEGGAGWRRLQEYGAERLVMDPDAVTRTEAMVAPEDTVPRRIVHAPNGDAVMCVPPSPAALSEQLSAQDVVLVSGSPGDPFVLQVYDAQLAAGAAVAFAPVGTDLSAALAAVRPTVVAIDDSGAAALGEQLHTSTEARVLRLARPDVAAPSLVPAGLPARPVVRQGDGSSLTRRQRAAPPSAFALAVRSGRR